MFESLVRILPIASFIGVRNTLSAQKSQAHSDSKYFAWLSLPSWVKLLVWVCWEHWDRRRLSLAVPRSKDIDFISQP